MSDEQLKIVLNLIPLLGVGLAAVLGYRQVFAKNKADALAATNSAYIASNAEVQRLTAALKTANDQVGYDDRAFEFAIEHLNRLPDGKQVIEFILRIRRGEIPDRYTVTPTPINRRKA